MEARTLPTGHGEHIQGVELVEENRVKIEKGKSGIKGIQEGRGIREMGKWEAKGEVIQMKHAWTSYFRGYDLTIQCVWGGDK